MVDVWLTYAQAGERFGITAEAARQIAIRRRWPRRKSNDDPQGRMQVLVPDDAETHPRTPVERPNEHPSDARSSADPDALADAIGTLREQLDRERGRADQAEARADRAEQARETERGRTDALRDQVDGLQREIVQLRIDAEIAERGAHETLAKATAEAAALRQADQDRRALGLLARLRATWRGE